MRNAHPSDHLPLTANAIVKPENPQNNPWRKNPNLAVTVGFRISTGKADLPTPKWWRDPAHVTLQKTPISAIIIDSRAPISRPKDFQATLKEGYEWQCSQVGADCDTGLFHIQRISIVGNYQMLWSGVVAVSFKCQTIVMVSNMSLLNSMKDYYDVPA